MGTPQYNKIDRNCEGKMPKPCISVNNHSQLQRGTQIGKLEKEGEIHKANQVTKEN